MEKGDLFSRKLIISTIPDSIVLGLPATNSISRGYKKSSQCTGLGIGIKNHSPIVLDYFKKSRDGIISL
jgi:hypothetical protein